MNFSNVQHILLNKSTYFAMAEEYVGLRQKFDVDDLMSKISLLIDMVLYPIYMIVELLFFDRQFSVFTILSFQNIVKSWSEWLRYRELKSEIQEWKTMIHSVGGPFISTNDQTYQSYVYADGMVRLRTAILSKECAKRL